MIDKIRILVGVDGSPNSDMALKEAVTIAKRFSGSIKIINVYDKGMNKKAEEIVNAAKQFCTDASVECEESSILGSNASRALHDTAKNENFDLIVVGSRGLGNAASLLLGSVSRQVVTEAECNVLVVKK
jgi:nucleotide-binding universal stress UspA family protein